MADDNLDQRSKRWRLALGALDDQKGDEDLNQLEQQIDQTLSKLYQGEKKGSLSKSLRLSFQWFANIRSLFPQNVVRVVQKDAIEKFGIKKLLSQPGFLHEVEPDIGLVASILSVKDALSPEALSQARMLVRKLAQKLEEQLTFKVLDRLAGRQDHKQKTKNPRANEVDWDLTIRHNMKHYQRDLQTIIPEVLIGRPKRHRALKRLVLLIDQSASMVESFIYAAILGSIMASIRSIKTHLIIFDTAVVDLTDHLHDPVELLMQSQLGGGTNIQRAMHYASQLLEDDLDTTIVLISDLFEGAPEDLLISKTQELLNRNVRVIVLLALDEQGLPTYDRKMAVRLAQLDVPAFAVVPEVFPEVMSAALDGTDLSRFMH
ncbi:MAG: VWA domain-containing protein [Saprospiraceae bacterium]|nr:VWA domain-containing protein [Saprospiraceae bacterium]